MSIDSTAELLFHIGADSDDAESNIARFRSVLGKDLEDMEAEFTEWREKLLGDISTVSGAMTAGGAVIGAAALAIGAALVEAADKYAEYVGEVARGTKTTGIAAEDMSKLKFAADETHTSYDSLVTGLTRFGSTIAKANEGGTEQQKMFTRLGISQDQVRAGEKDMMPLLLAVADSFEHMGSKTQRAAAARDLFSRGGAELVSLLALGSEGLKKFGEEAEEVGLIITSQDIGALKEYKAALAAIKAEQEALDVEWGRNVLPLMSEVKIGWLALFETVKSGHLSSLTDFISTLDGNFAKLATRVDATARAVGKLGDGSGIDDLDKPVEKALQDFRGLSGVLDSIFERMQSGSGDIGKAAAEMYKMQVSAAKVTDEFHKLDAAGKLTGESAAREAAVIAKLPKALADFWQTISDEANTKIATDVARFGDELQRKINAQGQQTLAVQAANFDLEIAGLRKQLEEKKDLTVEQHDQLAALIDGLEKAGDDKLSRDKAEAVAKAGDDLERRTAEQAQKSYTQQVAAWNREIDAMEIALSKEESLTAENQALIDGLRKKGLDKIERDRAVEYAREVSELQGHLATMLGAYMTQAERLEAQYDKDLRQFSDAERAKVLLTARTEEERASIEKLFDSMRAELLRRYGLDLQQLHNSQGWQGVFGSKFEQDLKRNEALLKQWATSTNQSTLLVKVALENLKEMASSTFDQFAQGMGAGIAQAIVYQKSIGAAMEAALKSTLESLAARALTEAIYATAWGFMDLAEQNYAGATAAFTAAAIFGSVGAAAGVAGSLIPGGASGGGASAGGSGSAGAASGNGASTGTTPAPGQTGPNVHVVVQGHVFGISGVQELASAINDAVLNKDVTLTATNTKTGQVVTR